jgi:acetylornithine deacetylase/succinyl-diaminopimelate desuccinylase-like protein
VIFVATGDEEEGGKLGAGWFVDHAPDLFSDAGFVLNEGGAIVPRPDGRKIYMVSVTEKTPMWLKLTATGPAGHASDPPAETAVTRLVRALQKLDEYRTPVRIIGPVENYYHAIAEIDHGPKQYLNLGASLKDPAYLKQFTADPSQNARIRDTIAPTVLSASHKTNVISETAYAEVDCRLLPGSDPKAFLRDIRKAIDDNSIKIDVILNFPPISSPSRSELMTAIEKMAKDRDKAPVVPTMLIGFTDSHYFRQKKLISYGFLPIEMNPAEAKGVHGVNERIGVKELADGIQRMVELLKVFASR